MAVEAGTTSFHRELQLPAGLVADLMDASTVDDVWALTLSGAHHAVGCDGVRVAELRMSPDVGYRVVAQTRQGPDLSTPMTRSPMSHPIIAHYVSTRFEGWVSLADLLPGRDWLEHPLYRDVYAPAGVRAQISCAIHDAGPVMLSLSLSRGGRDFSPRERRRLADYRRVVAAASHRARRRAAELRAAESLEQAVVGSARVALFSPDDGSIRYASPGFVAWRDRHPDVVATLLRHVRSGRTSGVLRVHQVTAHVSCVPTTHGLILTLEESGDDPFGLTPRETEVLAALTDGLTAQAIAHRLGISGATTRKHLEHIYSKLGVNDRLAAVTLARDQHLVVTGRPAGATVPRAGQP